jgi:hypothetical protein
MLDIWEEYQKRMTEAYLHFLQDMSKSRLHGMEMLMNAVRDAKLEQAVFTAP